MVGQSVPVETSGLSARHSPVWLSHILPPQLHAGGKKKGLLKEESSKCITPPPKTREIIILGIVCEYSNQYQEQLGLIFLSVLGKGVSCTGQV